jgi:hypothetical protein
LLQILGKGGQKEEERKRERERERDREKGSISNLQLRGKSLGHGRGSIRFTGEREK